MRFPDSLRTGMCVALRMMSRALYVSPATWSVLRSGTVIFLYHEVADDPSEFNRLFGLTVRPSIFEEQLEIIARHFKFIDPAMLASGDYPTPAALITFDDGNLRYFQKALPILRRMGVPSVTFLNMGPVLGDVCWSGLVTFLCHREERFGSGRRLRRREYTSITEREVSDFLATVDGEAVLQRARAFRGSIATKEEIAAVASDPLVYLGNHLYNHYNAMMLSEDRLKAEYRRNQTLLDAHPRGTRLFSYPFGQPGMSYNLETSRRLWREGAAIIFSAYALPNFGRGGRFYNRVAMTETIRSDHALQRAILTNYLPARLGLTPERLA